MFICNRCGEIFSQPKYIKDGGGDVGEDWPVCPSCGDYDYDEARECSMCGVVKRDLHMCCHISVSPVERETIGGYVYESYVALSGVKRLVKPVSRKGKKAEQEAMLLAESCESALVNHVLGKSGLALAGGAA